MATILTILQLKVDSVPKLCVFVPKSFESFEASRTGLTPSGSKQSAKITENQPSGFRPSAKPKSFNQASGVVTVAGKVFFRVWCVKK